MWASFNKHPDFILTAFPIIVGMEPVLSWISSTISSSFSNSVYSHQTGNIFTLCTGLTQLNPHYYTWNPLLYSMLSTFLMAEYMTVSKWNSKIPHLSMAYIHTVYSTIQHADGSLNWLVGWDSYLLRKDSDKACALEIRGRRDDSHLGIKRLCGIYQGRCFLLVNESGTKRQIQHKRMPA